MEDLKGIHAISKTLANVKDESPEVVGMLQYLRTANVTKDILSATGIGAAVNDLRKRVGEGEVKSMAKQLIKKWRKVCESTSVDTSRNGDRRQAASNVAAANIGSTTPPPLRRQWPSNPYNLRPSTTDHPLRLRCRRMLAEALQSPDHEGLDFELLGCAIEDAVFEGFGEASRKYITAVRGKILSIRHADNRKLKRDILEGNITARDYAKMHFWDHVGKEIMAEVMKDREERRKQHMRETNVTASSRLYKCAKCGKSDTSYTELQTRSADEPMTIFVSCNNCGNRWRN